VGLRTQRFDGDPRAALEEVYDKHANSLYQYALMILADHGAAEDAVQQAFLQILKLGKRIMEINSHYDYLRMSVRNECYRMLKKRRRLDSTVKRFTFNPLLERLDQKIISDDEQRLIEDTIARLPAEQREVLHMKVYENMTFQEIAQMIGVSMNTAASRYRYAMDKLRDVLGPGD